MLRNLRENRRGKKMKHRKRDPSSGISSSKSNISRAMRGRIPKVPNFLAIRNQQPETSTVLQSEQPTTSSTNTTTTTQPSRSSDRTRRSPSYYGFESPCHDSTIAAPPKSPQRAGDIENSPHLALLLKQCKTLLNTSRLNSTYLQE